MSKTTEELGIHTLKIVSLECICTQIVQDKHFTLFVVEDADGVLETSPCLTLEDFEWEEVKYPFVIFLNVDVYKRLQDDDLITLFVNEFGTAHLIKMGYIKTN